MKKTMYNVLAICCVAAMLACGNVLVAILCVFGMLACLHKAGVMNVWEELNSKY